MQGPGPLISFKVTVVILWDSRHRSGSANLVLTTSVTMKRTLLFRDPSTGKCLYSRARARKTFHSEAVVYSSVEEQDGQLSSRAKSRPSRKQIFKSTSKHELRRSQSPSNLNKIRYPRVSQLILEYIQEFI